MSVNGAQAPAAVVWLVKPTPVPAVMQVAQELGDDGKPLVRVMVHRPTGIDVVYLTGDEAELIGQHLLKLAGPTRLGLVASDGG